MKKDAYGPVNCDFTLQQIERAYCEWQRRVETLGECDVRVVVTRNLPARYYEEDRMDTRRYRFEAVFNTDGEHEEDGSTVDVELIGLRTNAAFNAVDCCIRGELNLFISASKSFRDLVLTGGNITLTLPVQGKTVSWLLDPYVRPGISLASEKPVSPRVCALVASPHDATLEAVQHRSRQLLAALPLLQAVLVVKLFARSRVDRTFACAAIVYVRDPLTSGIVPQCD